MRHIPMTMEDWEKRLNGFLSLMDREVLANAGRISAELAKAHAESEWEKYRIVQDRLYTSDFDRFVQLEERAATRRKEVSNEPYRGDDSGVMPEWGRIQKAEKYNYHNERCARC